VDLWRILLAIAIGVAILAVGVSVFRGVAGFRPREEEEPEAEDVADLDVYFVCGECGTEFRVEKLGQLQVPRHCGEPMRVERRPRSPVD
jgi:hypothetical protein